MKRTLKTNMDVLKKTITDVAQNMKPAMICMCEVGDRNALSADEMQQVADQSIRAWKDAATEHIQLRSMFTTGAPYMTIYIDGSIRCSEYRILRNLYYADGEPRTAQAFVCALPDGEGVDVVNVHAPSGGKKLKDSQRMQLLTNLLQSKSHAMPGRLFGNARFLIGGDMNTTPCLMSQLLQECRRKGSLHIKEQIHEPDFPKHGDLCLRGGFQANTLTTTALNHDPQHKPYGICWSTQQRSATEQPSSIRSTTHMSASSSSEYTIPQPRTTPSPETSMPRRLVPDGPVAEQPLPTPPTPPGTRETAMPSSLQLDNLRKRAEDCLATEQPLPTPPTLPCTREPAMPASLQLDNLQKRAEDSGLTESDIERELEGMHAQHGNILKPEDFHQGPQEEAAAAAATAATFERIYQLALQEDSEESTNLPSEKQLIYSIVNGFLNSITFHHAQAEELILAALKDESCLSPATQERVEEIFSPIFFEYTNGLKDRTVWSPRDTSQYIRQWYELASWRNWLTTDTTTELNTAQVSTIFTRYMENMKKTLRPEQEGRTWAYYKSCAQSKMRQEAGHAYVANAIWAIGLPRLHPFDTDQMRSSATEQRQDVQLSAQDLEAITEDIQNVLNWLDRVATTLLEHRATKAYQDAVRKSGIAHGQSGLSATEQETRAATRKAKFEMRTATHLAHQVKAGAMTYDKCSPCQQKLIHGYFDGSLSQNVKEATSQGSADTMCRTPMPT
jgi:hypothetical protein